jgi:hypothetical protein
LIEVHHNVFVGSEADEALVRGQSGWFVVHACKEPYHRQALGYQGRAAAKDHPEYLIARRPGRLILNLIDANDVTFIPAEIIDAALSEIHQNIASTKILVHCNQGLSRSPTIGFLYMLKFTDVFRREDYSQDAQDFLKIYPAYAPAQGMADYVRLNWPRYSSRM